MELSNHFKLLWFPSGIVSTRQIVSFLDPILYTIFKDLEHETIDLREAIQTQVKHLINKMAEINCDFKFKHL